MRPGLKGFQASRQAMNPPRKAANSAAVPNYVRTYAAGSYNWQCPKTGTYRFVLWGSGGGGDGNGAGGGSGGGAHAQKAVRVRAGQMVPLFIGGSALANDDGAATTVTLPSGLVRAGGGQTNVDGTEGEGGVATGGDINVSGNNFSGNTGGAAGGTALFPGGGASVGGIASSPGGGGGVSGVGRGGAGGYLIIVREGL